MAHILVIGAAGKIATHLLPRLVEDGHQVRAMVRDTGQLPAQTHIEVVKGDLESDFSSAYRDCDTVIFTAGSGPNTGYDKTLTVDLWGAVKAIDAAKRIGIKHFIMVSARHADNPDQGLDKLKPYLIAKHFADEHLVQSGLNYTILRPGRLLDEPGCGRITTQRPPIREEQVISREDTAEVIRRCVCNATENKQVIELYKGDQTIEEVLG